MLNLREYRNKADRLADHLPWGLLVGPGVILNKDGSFQTVMRFRGADLLGTWPPHQSGDHHQPAQLPS